MSPAWRALRCRPGRPAYSPADALDVVRLPRPFYELPVYKQVTDTTVEED